MIFILRGFVVIMNMIKHAAELKQCIHAVFLFFFPSGNLFYNKIPNRYNYNYDKIPNR